MKINYSGAEKCTYSSETPQKIAATRTALFDSDKHQIFCRLGLCPRPHWGSLLPSCFRGLLPRDGPKCLNPALLVDITTETGDNGDSEITVNLTYL